MKDWMVLIVIVLIVALAIGKIVIEKKRGNKCIGCPHGKDAGGTCGMDHTKKK